MAALRSVWRHISSDVIDGEACEPRSAPTSQRATRQRPVGSICPSLHVLQKAIPSLRRLENASASRRSTTGCSMMISRKHEVSPTSSLDRHTPSRWSRKSANLTRSRSVASFACAELEIAVLCGVCFRKTLSKNLIDHEASPRPHRVLGVADRPFERGTGKRFSPQRIGGHGR